MLVSMMQSTHTIFTIQTSKDSTESIVQIETVVNRGLYRFTILGMHQKHASDTKDRVYSALRSNDLLNLKSDNRKIIVNLTPDETDKKEGIYDLGISLSLLSSIDKKFPKERIIAVGGLSLTGKITPSRRLKQAIYAAYVHKIQYIVCSTEDLSILHSEDILLLKSLNIHIIAANSLVEAVSQLKNHANIDGDQRTFTSIKPNPEVPEVIKKDIFKFSELDEVNRTLLIAIGGGHNLLIQSPLSKKLTEMCKNICNTRVNTKLGQLLYTAFVEKHVDSDVTSDTSFIENIKLSSRREVDLLSASHKNCVLATYQPCSCGSEYSFFESFNSEKKCICSKKTVIQHKRHIESRYFDLFAMHITISTSQIEVAENLFNMIYNVRKHQFTRFAAENNLSNEQTTLFPDNSFVNKHRSTNTLEQLLSDEAKEVYRENLDIEHMLQIAQTIQDCIDLEQGSKSKKPVLSKQALLLAISYIPRMDF